jgi:nucleoside-diphosphate-sugar epimerase
MPAAKGCETIYYDLGDPAPDYDRLLHDIDVVIHLAGIAHSPADAMNYYEINSRGAAGLAAEAVNRGIKRFVFLSTIKVHGESTDAIPINEATRISPHDAYGKSKAEAEQAVIGACRGSGTEYAILRPPLVYGPHVKANFLRLMKAVARGLPLPLAGIRNSRSLIYVENLCDIIRRCIDRPAAGNQVFAVKDRDWSTPELIRDIGRAMGRRPVLVPIPQALLVWPARLFGYDVELRRLTGNLVIDNSKLLHALNWRPPVDKTTGMQRTVDWFLQAGRPG